VWPHDHARTTVTLALRVDIWKSHMPLKVVLRTLDGKRFDEAVATNAALDRVLPVPEDLSFPMLRFIDPHGSTVFNGSQMRGFLPEWDRLFIWSTISATESSSFASGKWQRSARSSRTLSSGLLAIEPS
jgi:hypothetical protein